MAPNNVLLVFIDIIFISHIRLCLKPQDGRAAHKDLQIHIVKFNLIIYIFRLIFGVLLKNSCPHTV